MVNLTEIQEELLRKILSEYKSNDYKYIDLKLNQQKDARLCAAIRELDGLYANNLLIREPDYKMGGAKLFLAEEAFNYFKLKDRDIAKYFRISLTEFQLLQYFVKELGGGQISFLDEDIVEKFNIDIDSISRILGDLEDAGYIRKLGVPTLDGDYDIIAYKDAFEDSLLDYKEDKENISINIPSEMNIINSILNIGDNNVVQTNSTVESLSKEVIDLLNKANEYLSKKEQTVDTVEVLKNIEELREMIEQRNIKTSEDIDALNVLIVKNQSKFRNLLSDCGSVASIFSVLQQFVQYVSTNLQ